MLEYYEDKKVRRRRVFFPLLFERMNDVLEYYADKKVRRRI